MCQICFAAILAHLLEGLSVDLTLGLTWFNMFHAPKFPCYSQEEQNDSEDQYLPVNVFHYIKMRHCVLCFFQFSVLSDIW